MDWTIEERHPISSCSACPARLTPCPPLHTALQCCLDDSRLSRLMARTRAAMQCPQCQHENREGAKVASITMSATLGHS
jgi:hypothetical protein